MTARQERPVNTNLGLIGRKLGNTQIFEEDGTVTRVTAIQTGPCVVVGKRSADKHGYSALQLGFGTRTDKHVNKPEGGIFKKLGIPATQIIREFRVRASIADKLEVGQSLKASEVFAVGQHVDVAAKSKGRGFTGVMKRWNFAGAGTDSHGTHEYRRHGGSIGTNMTPGRTLPNLKMSGQYGNERVTMLNLKIARVLDEENIVLVAGGVPGPRNGIVTVRAAVKKTVS
jgi:large subunit ribosomal protein L3